MSLLSNTPIRVCDVVNRTSEAEEISPVGSTTGGGGIFSGVFKPERAKALLEPRIQTLFTAPIEQFSKHGVHERFEMVGVTYCRASKGVPDVCELAVFDAVEPNIRHRARLLRGARAGQLGAALLLDSIAQETNLPARWCHQALTRSLIVPDRTAFFTSSIVVMPPRAAPLHSSRVAAGVQ